MREKAADESKVGKREPSIWFRVLLPDGAIGPGKTDLMRLIAETGSISMAAKRLRMSHVRSLKLVAELNALSAAPLIETRSGGKTGGGASITPAGRRFLDIYQRLETDLRAAAAPHLQRLVQGGHDA